MFLDFIMLKENYLQFYINISIQSDSISGLLIR